MDRCLGIIPSTGASRFLKVGEPWQTGSGKTRIIFVAHPGCIALDETRSRLFIGDYDISNQVFVVDTAEEKALVSLRIGKSPRSLCVDAKSGRLFVADEDGYIRVVSP
jgi:DNA-binding beta-propeller fold protein YncE